MDAAWPNGTPVLAPFLRYLARYLSAFEPCACADNGYRRLISELRSHLSRTIFASLNYDILLERVIHEFGFNGAYADIPNRNTAAVLKIHGSSNALPQLDGQLNDVQVVNFAESYIDGLDIEATLSTEEIRRWCEAPENDVVAPSMSVYAVGKRTPFCRWWVDQQREQWVRRLGAARRVMIIGVKFTAADHHIWGPLASSRAALTYINPSETDRDAVLRWRADTRRVAATECVPAGFLEALPLVLRRLRGA